MRSGRISPGLNSVKVLNEVYFLISSFPIGSSHKGDHYVTAIFVLQGTLLVKCHNDQTFLGEAKNQQR